MSPTGSGSPIGWVVIAISVVVLALWIPLRQRAGVGTIANVVLVGMSLDVTLAMLPAPAEPVWRYAFLLAAIAGSGVATGLYIGAGLGPGPRDGLMTGLAARGLSIRSARTVVELSVLALGWALGGSVGVGTLVYTLTIGPLAHVLIPLFAGPTPTQPTPTALSRITRAGLEHTTP